MISGIDSTSLVGGSSFGTSATSSQTGGFDAALAAAQKAAARQQAHETEMDAIKEKGFSNWVRDMRIEKLKEELRKKVMAAMGLDEDSMAAMDPMVQKILEQKIQDEVDKQLAQVLKDEEMKNGGNGQAPSQTVAQQATAQAGNNDRRGKTCPVIPALAGAEGVVIF
ncbi:hypothetical protein [Magnetospirillum sp. 64-120]|uniref:hypothetical protein n=1 Tax=Magnetospirillum sp. 64-120 TaxID=1895778 RepID=UPI00092AB23F|nr:hypothetical protein [Magnetospirillum sp. 64-120]OJX79344.1 MAG: hypothetical protein BGO92_12715 [Magnetospirillum sp. 64-120]